MATYFSEQHRRNCYKCPCFVFTQHTHIRLLSPAVSQFVQHVCWNLMPSVLWRCWLGGRKGIRPIKKQSGGVLAWLSWLEQGADLHMAQLMPLQLTVCCFSKIQIGFTILVPAHLGSPGQRAVKWVCVWYCRWRANVKGTVRLLL